VDVLVVPARLAARGDRAGLLVLPRPLHLVDKVRDASDLRLCGAGVPCPGGTRR